MIRFHFQSGVTPVIRSETQRIADGFLKFSEVRHELPIYVHKAKYKVFDPSDGSSASGWFYWPDYEGQDVIHIVLAGGLCEQYCNHKGQIDWINVTLLHELVHYEQWRDGKIETMSNAGCEGAANSRSKALYRKIGPWEPPPPAVGAISAHTMFEMEWVRDMEAIRLNYATSLTP